MRQRPKIGLALSGASGRAIAHIGVLEVLREHGVPIDYISACSSGTVIAASYACGTLDMIKERLLKIDKQSFFQLLNLEKNGEGIFNLDKVEQEIKKYTLGKRFEDVRPMLNFVACDLDSGEGIGLTLGDLARACRISCSVPALFPPEHWGNKLLVDGGLFSLVPADQARGMGADIVIGVDIAATPYAFKESYVHVWRGYNYLKNSILLRPFRYIFNIFNNVYKNSVKIIFYNQSDSLAEELNNNDLDLFTILGRAMKIASERHKNGKLPVCDIMLSPDVKHMGKVQLRKSKLMYYEGRRVALEAIPKIKKLIEDFKADHKLEAVLQNAERS